MNTNDGDENLKKLEVSLVAASYGKEVSKKTVAAQYSNERHEIVLNNLKDILKSNNLRSIIAAEKMLLAEELKTANSQAQITSLKNGIADMEVIEKHR